MMRNRSERLLKILRDVLLPVLDDLWSLGDQNAVFCVKTSNPRRVVIVPSIMVLGDDLFNLFPGILIDLVLRW